MGCGGRPTHFTDKDPRDDKTKALVEGHPDLGCTQLRKLLVYPCCGEYTSGVCRDVLASGPWDWLLQ